MKKVKKYLLFVFLVVACCCCLTSCSCSFGSSRGGGNDGGDGGGSEGGANGGGENPPTTTYYEVTVSLNDDSAGEVVSSTGSFVHLKGDSAVYTVKPNNKWGIQKIIINGVVEHSNETGGYIYEDYTLEFSNISDNIEIEVDFAQVHFAVNAEVLDVGFSSSEGATITGDEVGAVALGGTSTEMVITPTSGYVIYKVTLFDDDYYNYSAGDPLAVQPMVVTISKVTKTVNLKVYAYKLENVEPVFMNYHTGGLNKYGESSAVLLTGSDALIGFSIDGFSGMNIPNGYEGKLLVTLKDRVRIVGYEYSNDGGLTYSDYFGINATVDDSSVVFNHEDNSFYISGIHTNFRLKVYTSSDEVGLTIYNPSAGTGSQMITQGTIYLYSHYIIITSDMATNYTWHYSTSQDYTESNTHKNATIGSVVHPTSGETVYFIYITPEMLTLEDKIILIYKPI